MKVIFDTDAGVDDAIALMVALHHFPRGTVDCITTVFGNTNVAQASHNAHKLAQVMGQPDIPVFTGASRPIIKAVSDEKWEGHGKDGLGGTSGAVVPDSAMETQENQAVPALLRKSHEFKGELVLVAVGPLTNIALAIAMDPTFMSRIKKIYVMGGIIYDGRGNFTSSTEFNVGCDPEATSIVLEHCHADQLIVVPWETCFDYRYTWEEFDKVFEHPKATTAAASFLRDAWKMGRVAMLEEGFVPCDVYAMAILVNESVATKQERLHGSIYLSNDSKRGLNLWQSTESNVKSDQPVAKPNAMLVTEVDKKPLMQQIQNLAFGELV